MFRGPSFIVSTMQEETTNPLGQCWVPPIVAFYNQQGLLRTYSLLGSSIRSPHPNTHRYHIYEMRWPFVAVGLNERFIVQSYHRENQSSSKPSTDVTQEMLCHPHSNKYNLFRMRICVLFKETLEATDRFQDLVESAISRIYQDVLCLIPSTPKNNIRSQRTKRQVPSDCTPTSMKRDSKKVCLGGSTSICHQGLFVCLWDKSGQLFNELFPDYTRSCFSQVILGLRGGDRIYEMRCLFVAVGPNARFIVLPHWDNMS